MAQGPVLGRSLRSRSKSADQRLGAGHRQHFTQALQVPPGASSSTNFAPPTACRPSFKSDHPSLASEGKISSAPGFLSISGFIVGVVVFHPQLSLAISSSKKKLFPQKQFDTTQTGIRDLWEIFFVASRLTTSNGGFVLGFVLLPIGGLSGVGRQNGCRKPAAQHKTVSRFPCANQHRLGAPTPRPGNVACTQFAAA